MRKVERDNPEDVARARRLLGLKRNVQLVTMGAIVIFILLSFVLPPEIGRLLFPLVIISLAAYTAASGFVAYEVGITGIRAIDDKRGWARRVGILWLFAAAFLAIFGLTYFFN